MPVKKTTSAKTTTTKKKTEKAPKLEDFLAEIQRRAYDIYLERTKKGLPGNDMSDWLEAEKEIKEKYNIK
ncbi:MAG: DUF2934 domain-containing protein [Brevinematia bacterium]